MDLQYTNPIKPFLGLSNKNRDSSRQKKHVTSWSVYFCSTLAYLAVAIFPCSAAPLLDLEDMVQDFVVETKKIEIPGYPDAFNPSILRWNDSLLLSFRTGDSMDASGDDALLLSFRFREHATGSTNQIGLVLLDKDFNLISTPQVLEIPRKNPMLAFRQQDPRLIRVGDRVFIVYSNIIEGLMNFEIRRMFIAELFFDGTYFTASEPECLSRFEGENEQRWQKNWVPFDYNGALLLGYSIVPHRILEPILGTGGCAAVSSTSGSIQWDWGVLRGGTPAILDGDEYLAFFHSSKEMPSVHSQGKKISHYVMGAYTFSSRPPFSITRISPEPIVGKNFYHGPAHNTWKPLWVVFPGGFVSNDEYVWIAYGRQDHEVWIVKLDKKGLLDSLVPVSTVK